MSTPPITTPSAGAGTMAAGTGPAGLYSPATVAGSPSLSAGSRYVNPSSGDFEIDSATGQFAQMPPTRQRVLLALKTVVGSATAAPDFGLRAPRKIGRNYVAQTRQEVRSALRHLTSENSPVIRIQAIDVVRIGSSHLVATVSYVDLQTGRADQVSNV